MSKVNSSHINDIPVENLRALCKQYYVAKVKGQHRIAELERQVKTLNARLAVVESLADEIIGAINQ